ncbi:AAA family ATPase [Chloroflexota bacterium]
MSELPESIQAMLDPQIYPEPIREVEMLQTQMSFLFLTRNHVYKVKKAVNLGYLDYTTLSKRLFYCQREVELNRRLCPKVYLGVVPLTKYRSKYFLEGKDKAVEYVVKMLRLPRFEMMDFLLENNRVTPQMVARVAQKMAEFHQRALTNNTISVFGSLDTIIQNNEENFSQTEKYIGGTISQKQFQSLKDFTTGFIENNRALFQERAAGGKIRDCHGDLHAAHVCFADDVCIYDCIEFNDRFRYCDVASEIAFMAMDLDHYGRADLSRHFVDAYIGQTQDNEIGQLLNFYKCYRAYVRGKVSSFKTADPYVGREEKKETEETARSYFELAASYARLRPLLLITTGVTGTGKSTLAQALAGRMGLVVLSSDVTRKQLAGVPLTEPHQEGFHDGIYTPEFSRKTYDRMFAEAAELLDKGVSVILDASFIKSEDRRQAQKLAQSKKADFFLLHCVLDEENIKERLDERSKKDSVSDGRLEILSPQLERFDPITEVTAMKHIIVDSSFQLTTLVHYVLKAIG